MKIRLWALALALCLLTSLLPARAQAEEIDVPVDKNAVLSGLYEADIASLREAMDLGFITSRELICVSWGCRNNCSRRLLFHPDRGSLQKGAADYDRPETKH